MARFSVVRSVLYFTVLYWGAPLLYAGAPAVITIHADKPGIRTSPTLYGIFFEDISRSADGGLYAELVQNRSFEDGKTPVGWEVSEPGAVTIESGNPIG